MAVKGRLEAARGQRSRAVFLDKDGTLIEDFPYNVDPDEIVLAPGAQDALLLLKRHGVRLFVVTTQPGVAYGFFAESALVGVERRLAELFEEVQAPLEGFYYCPHSPRGNLLRYTRECDCRKPSPGLILRAAREHDIAPERSWMIGDILDDVECGRRAGCRTVLIDNGNETEWHLSAARRPDWVARDLFDAASLVVRAELEPAGRSGEP